MPDYFPQYTAEVMNTEYNKPHDLQYFIDLDGDSISEKISLGYNYQPENKDIRLVHFMHNGNVLGYDYLNGTILERTSLTFGDFDQNNYKEVYFLTLRNDSIFLQAKELMKKGGLSIKDRFITVIGTYGGGKQDVKTMPGTLINNSNNNNSELIFTLYAGYSKYPRKTYVYNIKKDSLRASPNSAAGFYPALSFMDLNKDGFPEITGSVAAHENIHYEYPYTDSAYWLMVLDSKTMDFHFPPIRYDFGIGSHINPVFFHLNGYDYIVSTSYRTNKKNKDEVQCIQLHSAEGKLLKELNLPGKIKKITPINPNKNKGYIYFLDHKGHIYQSDTTLKLKKIFDQDKPFTNYIMPEYIPTGDINNPKESLIICSDNIRNNYLMIYSADFKNVTKIHLAEPKNIRWWHYCEIKKANQKSDYSVQAGEYSYIIKYEKNAYFLYKYPIYIIIYFIIFLLFWMLQRVQIHFAKKSFETEKQLMQQQMALSKKQMEPHFMLNMINNIGYMFSKDNKQDAMFYLGKFGSLMRQGLINSQASQITLEEELEFVEDYLILQKKLMDDELEYSINVEDVIEEDKIQIPHSLIYTFVENAIKHGLKPKVNDRKMEIRVEQVKEQTRITIQDNGIGRQRSKELNTTDTGKGMEIIKTIIKGYNQLYGEHISYTVEDVLDKQREAMGAKVEIWF
jgi:hypothetical protein